MHPRGTNPLISVADAEFDDQRRRLAAVGDLAQKARRQVLCEHLAVLAPFDEVGEELVDWPGQVPRGCRRRRAPERTDDQL